MYVRLKPLTVCLTVCLAVAFAVTCSAEVPKLQLRQNEVIGFLGGTNTVNLQRAGYLEAMMINAHPEAKLRFRDLAWEGDTVFWQNTKKVRWREDKFGDLTNQLNESKISVVVLNFGQSEALTGGAELEKFVRAYADLISTCKESDRRVIIISPIPFQATESPLPDLTKHNAVLEQYVRSIEQLARRHECRFVNLFADYQSKPLLGLSKNGVHVRPMSQQDLAQRIGKQFGLSSYEDRLNPLRQEIIAKHKLWTSYWRPANWKCLYGDDGEREFGKSTAGGPTLREEWQQLPGMVAAAEKKIWQHAKGSVR